MPIPELAERFGTPLYVYDASAISRRIADLQAFDVIRYAQKANSNLAILDFMLRRNVVVDAVSAGEIRRAQAAGFSGASQPPGIVYTADIFDRDALDIVVSDHIPVNAGSLDMIEQLGDRAPGRNIMLRINPGFGHGHSQKTNTGGEQSKHGIWHGRLGDALLLADRCGLGITGLHMHIGSGSDLEHLAQVCSAMESAARTVGRTVMTISAGGGLPIAYRATDTDVDIDAYFSLWDATRKRLESEFGHRVTLEIEPGRYLVAESGYLIAEIRAVKRTAGKTFYLVDAGFNNLARPILYGAYHPMSVCRTDADEPGLLDVVVGGPLCESGDIFTQEEGGFVRTRSLPAARVGDFLVIERAGAYGAVMASNYNSKPFAAEVLVEQDRCHLIRDRQSYEDLMRGERIPAR
ncbi:MAG: diaminopimelate decarboxylase [Planctomycetes bacterium]|nr:diaminopimelate decarboxylase [Planctomycetota bacterium]